MVKAHGDHICGEEYRIPGGDERIKLILNTISRVEEALHGIPYDDFTEIMECAARLSSKTPIVRCSEVDQVDQEDQTDRNIFQKFSEEKIEKGEAEDYFTLKEAKKAWMEYAARVRVETEEIIPMSKEAEMKKGLEDALENGVSEKS